MKSVVLVAAFAVMLAGVASADTCGGATDVLTSGFSCTVNNMLFSNFSATDAGGTPSPVVFVLSSRVDPDGTVWVDFNPFFTGPAPQDIHFQFTVTGLTGTQINGIDLFVGGLLASINETACSLQFGPGGFCATANVLANIAAFSAPGTNTASGFFAPTGTIYIFKDIAIGQGGTLTNFSQSFHTPIPEPATMALFGAGLISLGATIRRRMRS